MPLEEKVAVIDLGTNTFHLLLARLEGGRYSIYHRERVAVKIGMGGINHGIITEAGMFRALEGLRRFRSVIDKEGVRKVVALGTSALRGARNGDQVAARIEHDTGIKVRIISGDEEAQYIYLGVRKAVAMGTKRSLIVDIGGGSVEFIIADGETVFWKQSFDIGAQRLLERFQEHDPILPSEVEQLNRFFDQTLKPLALAAAQFRPAVLVGSSGTFDTLSDIHRERAGLPIIPHDPETPLTFESFDQTHLELLTKNRAQRLAIPGMMEMRVDMIVVAVCLIRYLLDHFLFEKIRVSSYSLKEGVLASLETEG